MKKILFEHIISFLKKENIEYIVEGKPLQYYYCASLFNLIPNGFYFLVGNSFNFEISDSLILTDAQIKFQTVESKNTVIRVKNSNPQRIYYKLLSETFGMQSNGIICNTALVSEKAKIGSNVQIDAYCVIGECEIGDNCIVGSHTVINNNSIIGNDTIIETQSTIGTAGVAWIWDEKEENKILQPQLGGTKIGRNCFIGAQAVIVRGSSSEYSEIGDNSFVAPGLRMGHGTKIGKFVHFANNVVTGGNVQIGDYSFVGCNAVFRPKVKVHKRTIVGAGSVVVKNTSQEGLTLKSDIAAKEFPTKESPQGMPKPKKA